MSPFKSSKLSLTSLSSKYLSKRQSTLGVAVTSTSNETFSSGNFNYIAFRSPGQFTVNRSGKIDICVVGGGGGGGQGNAPPSSPTTYGAGGGGGAGGLLQQYDLTFGVGTYTVTIGGGGAGGTRIGFSPISNGFNGSPTSIVSPGTGIALTAFGGGGGGGWAPGTSGLDGASGGGGWDSDTGGGGNFISASPTSAIQAPLQPQGYPGGQASLDGGGGGGGAAEAGLSAGPYYGGIGGAGERIFGGDAGITTTYGTAAPAPYAPGRYIAGGGGGGNAQTMPFPAALNIGGVGGGGGGGFSSPPGASQLPGSAATIYTGGGGGGGYYSQSGAGGAGAPGVVIIRYRTILDD